MNSIHIEEQDMDGNEQESLGKDYFSIVYHELRRGAKLSIEAYIILETMLFKSKNNMYQNGISFLSRRLFLSRNTIYKHLDCLARLGYIEKDEKEILVYQGREIFSSKGGTFIKIYHCKRKELGLSVQQFAFLYMIYSLSRKNGNKNTCSGYGTYCSYLDMSKRHLHSTLEKFKNLNLIEPKRRGSTTLKLEHSLFKWFQSKE